MNITALISLYLLKSQSVATSNEITIEVGNSLRYVIDNFVIKHTSSIVVFISCQNQNHFLYFTDLLPAIFSRSANMKMEIMINKVDGRHKVQVDNFFNFIFTDNADMFMQIDLAAKIKNYDKNEYYFVFLQNCDKFIPEDLQRIFDYCWKNYIINVDILTQNSRGEIIIHTYFPFTAEYCGKVIPAQINRYRNGTMDNKNIFPEKLLNMYQCPVKIALRNIPPFLTIDVHKKGRNAIGGFEGALLKALSELMNFRIDYKVLPIIQSEQINDKGMIHKRKFDLEITFRFYLNSSASIFTLTDTYYSSRGVFVVLQESPSYIRPEIIFFPFSPTIWVLLIFTFFLVLGIFSGTICWARRNSLEVSQIALNNFWMPFVAMTLGMASILSPRRYFGKVLLIMWMFCTLVLRTQYQALIYHLIRHNFFQHPPNGLDEVLEQKFTFVVNHHIYNNLINMTFFQQSGLKVKLINSSELESVLSHIEEQPNEKLVAFEPNEFSLDYRRKNHKVDVFTTLPESMFVQRSCIYLTKHSILINRIDDLIGWIIASGFMNVWAKKAMHLSYFVHQVDVKQNIIRYRELKVAFYLCGTLLVFSFVIFVLEIFSVRNKTLRRAFEKL